MPKNGKYFIPSLADMLFLSVFLYLSFSAGQGLLGDGDTGYHIRAGEYIIKTLSIPKSDMFSFISPSLPWTAHEWLSEVIMAVVHSSFGLTGIVIFFSFFIALSYYLLFKIVRSHANTVLIPVFVVILVIVASQIHWLARPHVFSLLLIIIWYHLLDEFQYRAKNRLFLMPPLMLLWVNLHGGYMAGIILVGIYLVGNALKFIQSQGIEKGVWRAKCKPLGIILAACLAAALINPYGYHILLFPFTLASEKYLMNHVTEFLSPNFHEKMFIAFELLLLLVVALFARTRTRLNSIELMLMLLFVHMSLYSARYIPLLGVIAAPILVRQSELLMQEEGKFIAFIKKRSDRISAVDATARGYLWPVAAVLLVLLLSAMDRIGYNFDKKIKPLAAIEFLKREHIKGNMLNNDEFGDIVIYSAYPHYKVFIDGRLDMYGVKRVKEYHNVMHFKPGWETTMEKYGITWILINADSTFSRFLLQRTDWVLIYADKVAHIFVKNIPDYKYLIEKYRDVEPVVEEEKPDGAE